MIDLYFQIFGVIIDTFADLRSEKQQKEEIIKNSCFICGKNTIFCNLIENEIEIFETESFPKAWSARPSTTST